MYDRFTRHIQNDTVYHASTAAQPRFLVLQPTDSVFVESFRVDRVSRCLYEPAIPRRQLTKPEDVGVTRSRCTNTMMYSFFLMEVAPYPW